MVGHKLITKQTPPDGILVKKVMVAKSVNITRETYVCIVMDRDSNGPVLVASPAGGMDIEAVAEKTPELILKVPIDITQGLSAAKSKEIAQFLQFKGPLVEKAAAEILKFWTLFLKLDAVQIEINPLAETDDGQVISVDAKLDFDDNAQFRHKDIFEMEDTSETDPKEIEAAKYNLNYVAMDGDIGCLVNGAGLAMATMDIIKLNGSSPANFLDVGGNVKADQVLELTFCLSFSLFNLFCLPGAKGVRNFTGRSERESDFGECFRRHRQLCNHCGRHCQRIQEDKFANSVGRSFGRHECD